MKLLWLLVSRSVRTLGEVGLMFAVVKPVGWVILTCGTAPAASAFGGVFSLPVVSCGVGSERGVEGEGGTPRGLNGALGRLPPRRLAPKAAMAL